MGVPRAFPHLRMRQKRVNISRFSGATVAVDVMGYVVQGHYRIMKKVGLASVDDTKSSVEIVSSIEDIVQTIINAGCTVYLVTDGKKLPKKAKEHEARAKKRDNDLVTAEYYFQLGRKKEARKYLARSTIISPAVLNSLKGIANKYPNKCFYVGSLFEADSQIGYLAQNNLCDLVISHDSDMMLFGCPKVLFTMNKKGWGWFYETANIPTVLGWEEYNHEKFLKMMILSKCEYVKNIPGIGIAKAQKIIEATPNLSTKSILTTVVQLFPNSIIPEDYDKDFDEAYLTYLYSAVVDPRQMESTRFHSPPPSLTEEYLGFAGHLHNKTETMDIVLGNIHLNSGRPSQQVSNTSELDVLFPPECFFNPQYRTKNQVMEFYIQEDDDIDGIEEEDEDDERPKEYPCPDCDKVFNYLSRLLIHGVQHSGVKAFSCQLCKRAFGYQVSLDLHMRMHEGARKFKCEVCGIAFTRQDVLSNHLAVHSEERSFQCNKCGDTFKTNSSLCQHMEVHSEERSYECDQCDLCFKRIRNLNAHKATVHVETRPFKCDKCDKDFSRKDALDQHVLAIHTKDRPFVCDVCKMAFNDASHLRRHKRTVHTERKPFKCLICPNIQYSRSDHLTRHMKDSHPTRFEEFKANKKRQPSTDPSAEPPLKKPK